MLTAKLPTSYIDCDTPVLLSTVHCTQSTLVAIKYAVLAITLYSEYVLLVVRIAIPSVLYYWYAIRSTTGHGMFNTTGTNVCLALISSGGSVA